MTDTPAAPTTPRCLRCGATWVHRDDYAGLGTPHKFEEAEARASAPLDVPREAIEWARELVRQGYRDEHIVTFTEDGYGLEHPIRCRPNLTGCILNEWLRTQMAPDREPGRYVMEWTDDGPTYARLTTTDEGADR